MRSPARGAAIVASMVAPMLAPMLAVASVTTGLWLGACSVSDKQPSAGDGGLDAVAPDAMPGGAPNTTITMAPAEFSQLGSATFHFTADLANVTFECSFDSETPVGCTSPYTRALPDGIHSFAVRAIDNSGTEDDTPAEHLWTIDTAAPDTQLTKVPPAADNSTMVTFAFDSREPNVSFDCALDGAAFAPCASNASIGPVGDGAHSFQVRARDRAGNVDISPAIHAWSVDTSTPDTQLLAAPVGASSSTVATFTFVSPDAGSGATYECVLDGAVYLDCTSPLQVSGLAEGAHTFSVRVRDAVGNFDPTPATRTWTVDLTPPDTMLLSGPNGTVQLASASFSFSATEPDASFVCSLDGSPFAACTSPFHALALAQGAHTFAVQGTDAAGHPDPTPATRSWTVDTVAPEIVFTVAPPIGGTSGPRVTIEFTVSDGTIACSLDELAFAACTSPVAFNVRAGPHSFRVRATDAAGNTATAVRSWSVVCAAPAATGAAGVLHLDDSGQVLVNATGGPAATLGSNDTVEPADPTLVASGRFGGAVAFNADEADLIAWPVAIVAAPELTVELWAQPGGRAGDLFVSGDGRVAIRVIADGATAVRFSATFVDGLLAPHVVTSAPVVAGAWHHVLASLQDPALRLWVDGVRTEAVGITSGSAPALDNLLLGAGYTGTLDEVWIAQTAITDDESALARYCPL